MSIETFVQQLALLQAELAATKTAVKKYMGVHELPIGGAWIVKKTTVKLET